MLDPAGESRHPGVDPWHSGQSALVTGGDDPDLHPVAGVLLLVEETAAAVTLAGVSPSLLQAGTHEGVVNLNSGGRPFSLKMNNSERDLRIDWVASCLCTTACRESWI